jgi:hypothetical protein
MHIELALISLSAASSSAEQSQNFLGMPRKNKSSCNPKRQEPQETQMNQALRSHEALNAEDTNHTSNHQSLHDVQLHYSISRPKQCPEDRKEILLQCASDPL